jgi:3-isopropylmalate/(R)-2-methylmalate dehydratase small subunit
VQADPSLEITIDMENLTVSAPKIGIESSFPMDAATQHRFLEGLDDVGITLTHAAAIDAFEAARPGFMPSV